MRALVLAVATLALLWSNLEAYPSPNTMSNVLLAYRFVTVGSARIDGFEDVPPAYRDWSPSTNGPQYDRFAPGDALALAPAVGAAILAGTRPADVVAWAYVDKLVASLLVLVAALAMYFAARRIAGPDAAFLATFAVIAGTSIASVAGQRTWQHAPALAGTALGWLMLVKARDDERWLAVSGLPFAFATITRYPLGAVWLLALAYVAVVRRRAVPRYLLWSAAPFVFLAIYDFVLFGSPADTAYAPQLWQWSSPEGLAGSLIAPSRGVFVYSPFLLLGLWALARRALHRDLLASFAVGSFVVLWLVHGLYIEWWGGWSFGNRYLIETMPPLAAGVAIAWSTASPRVRWIAGAAIAFAVFLQVAALLGYYHFWNGVNWDVARERRGDGSPMWDLGDPQWVWTIGSAAATGGVRALIVVPVAAAFAYLAFRRVPARAPSTDPFVLVRPKVSGGGSLD